MRWLRWLRDDSSGTTLAELLVYVGLLTAFVGTMGTAFFQASRTQPAIVDDGLATNELRRGFSWFADDARMARNVLPANGVLALRAPEDGALILSWTDYFQDAGTPHTVTYSVIDGLLIRDDGTGSHAVARRVQAATFTIDEANRTITAELAVTAGRGATETLSLKTIMRPETP